MGTIIGTIIFGAVIGVLARLVIPGKQSIGWLITIALGVAGALIGYWVWGLVASEGNTDTAVSTGSGGQSASPLRRS